MKMRQGDFSELLAVNGSPVNIPIYDSANAQSLNNSCTPGSTGTRVCRTAFARNIIPAGRIYGPALAFMQFFAEPYIAGTDNGTQYIFITDQNLILPYRSFLVRIDHLFSESTRFFGK